MGLMSNSDKADLGTRLPELAARMDSDMFLQCAEAYGYVVYFAVDVALRHAKPPATEVALKRYLRSRSIAEIAKLEDHHAILFEVRKLLPGPLGDELPALAGLPGAIDGKPYLVRWFIESTRPSLAALYLARNGGSELADTRCH